MGNKNTITLNGVNYPLRPTMGAFIRFKQMTGIDTKDMEPGDIEQMCVYFYCLIVSACSADKIEFPYNFIGNDNGKESFVDLLTPELMAEINAKLAEGVESEEKKTANN